MIKTKVTFWSAGFYLANQSNLKSFQKTLIGWKKPVLQKIHFCFGHVNRLIITLGRPISMCTDRTILTSLRAGYKIKDIFREFIVTPQTIAFNMCNITLPFEP